MNSERRMLSVTIAVMLAVSGCSTTGLMFVQDQRVSILAPAENATVRLPFDVTWEASDYDSYFAVFLDQAPMRPGQSLLSIVPENDPCRTEARCPTADWLASRNVYVTRGTSVTISILPEQRTSQRSKDRHELTVVLLDEDGRRGSEAVFHREFLVER